MMKIDRHDQAKILSSDELSQLFNQGLKTTRDRALFGVCLYTGARIAEACSLHTKWMPKPGFQCEGWHKNDRLNLGKSFDVRGNKLSVILGVALNNFDFRCNFRCLGWFWSFG